MPVPDYRYVCEPGNEVSAVFGGYPVIPGIPMDALPRERVAQAAYWWRPVLAQFLRRLHAFPVERARALGVPDVTVDRAESGESWTGSLQRLLDSARRLLPDILGPRELRMVLDGLDVAIGFARSCPVALIHGNFVPRHVLIDLDLKCVRGVIDFSDLALGDVAHDVWNDFSTEYSDDTDLPQRRIMYTRARLAQNLVWRMSQRSSRSVEQARMAVLRAWSGNVHEMNGFAQS
jgi:aminoglycoside phosphotransferase (APT) family kinase protein